MLTLDREASYPHPVTGAPMRLRSYKCVNPLCGSRRGYWMTNLQYALQPKGPHYCACGADRWRASMDSVKHLPDELVPALPFGTKGAA